MWSYQIALETFIKIRRSSDGVEREPLSSTHHCWRWKVKELLVRKQVDSTRQQKIKTTTKRWSHDQSLSSIPPNHQHFSFVPFCCVSVPLSPASRLHFICVLIENQVVTFWVKAWVSNSMLRFLNPHHVLGERWTWGLRSVHLLFKIDFSHLFLKMLKYLFYFFLNNEITEPSVSEWNSWRVLWSVNSSTG